MVAVSAASRAASAASQASQGLTNLESGLGINLARSNRHSPANLPGIKHAGDRVEALHTGGVMPFANFRTARLLPYG